MDTRRSDHPSLAVRFADELPRFVYACLAGGLAELQDTPLPDPLLRRKCQHALERLWMRRGAVARALSLPPRPAAAQPPRARGIKDWTLVDESTIELNIATAHLVRALLDAAECEWREPTLGAEAAPEPGGPAWPPEPVRCAAGLRWAVQQASDEHDVRLALMRLALRLLPVQFAAACRRQLARLADADADAALPGADATPPRAPAVAAPAAHPTPTTTPTRMPTPTPTPQDLLEAARPGQWFRMVLYAQWADARVTWRSANGRFFLFSSQLAGRSHSISRTALERLIERGEFRPLDRRSSRLPHRQATTG